MSGHFMNNKHQFPENYIYLNIFGEYFYFKQIIGPITMVSGLFSGVKGLSNHTIPVIKNRYFLRFIES